jgi:hypothetical protein
MTSSARCDSRFAGLEERDRLVLEGCAARGIPVVVTLGGGYARQVSDTVRIHTANMPCRLVTPAHGARERLMSRGANWARPNS